MMPREGCRNTMKVCDSEVIWTPLWRGSIKCITGFISRFKGSENTFLFGCCYWFAHILHERFGLSIVYEPEEGHFLATGPTGTLCDGVVTTRGTHIFDIRGDVTDLYYDKDLYSLNWLSRYEPKWFEHLMRDCRNFSDSTKEEK